MTDKEIKYSIGSGVVEKHEAAVFTELSTLYPNKEDRLIVETTLFPHFRAQVAVVYNRFRQDRKMASDQPVAPTEVKDLLDAIDGMIKDQSALLDVEGLFKPVIDHIHTVRNEIAKNFREQFYEKCRELLAEKGIVDETSLSIKGVAWFMKTDFSPFGKGITFAKKILGENLRKVSRGNLKKIVEILKLDKLSKSSIQKYRDALAEHCITDRSGLLEKGPKWFTTTNFHPYGKGIAFAGKILGERFWHVTISDLKRIATTLDLPDLSEESKKDFRGILAQHGLTDRSGLLGKGSKWFMRTSFPPHEKGMVFAGNILGERFRRISISDLERIATTLDLPDLSEESKKGFRETLSQHGITDRSGLLGKGSKWFIGAGFPPYGKGTAFAGKILGERLEYITISDLERIAGILFPAESNSN